MSLVKYTKVAVKSLRDRSIRSWITIIGIVVSIAVILVLFTLSAGLQTAVVELFEDFGTNRIFILNADGSFGGLTSQGLLQKDVEGIRGLSEFKLVIPQLMVPAEKVTYRNTESFVNIYGIPSEDADAIAAQYKFDRDIEFGRYFSENQRRVAVVGYNVANKEDDFFGRKLALRNKLTIRGVDFEIIGIYKRMGTEDDNIIYIPLTDARSISNKTEEVTAIDAILSDGISVDVGKERLERFLERTKGKDTFTIITPEAVLRQFSTVVFIVQAILLAIASISLLVGAIGIANTMFTAVLEREKEIGIMKSIGAKNRDILQMFMIESGLIGLIGGIAGVILGIGISLLIGQIAIAAGFSLLTIKISPLTVIGCLLFAFVVGVISGFLPSYLGSKKKIVDTLRDQ